MVCVIGVVPWFVPLPQIRIKIHFENVEHTVYSTNFSPSKIFADLLQKGFREFQGLPCNVPMHMLHGMFRSTIFADRTESAKIHTTKMWCYTAHTACVVALALVHVPSNSCVTQH